MPAGYDAEVAELFRDLRAATALSEMDLAAKLGTRADVVQSLEQGALYALPPWAETCRVVNAYGALLNLDVRPLLRRIYAQLEAGIVELQPKQMPDVPMMTPPAEPQDYSFTPSNSGASSAPNPLDIPWPPPSQAAPPAQRNPWPNGPTAPSPQPQAPWQNAQPQPQPQQHAWPNPQHPQQQPQAWPGSQPAPQAPRPNPQPQPQRQAQPQGQPQGQLSVSLSRARRNPRLRSRSLKRKQGRNRCRRGRRPRRSRIRSMQISGSRPLSSHRLSRKSRAAAVPHSSNGLSARW